MAKKEIVSRGSETIVHCQHMQQGKVVLALGYADKAIVDDKVVTKRGIFFDTEPVTKRHLDVVITIEEALRLVKGKKKWKE